MIHADRTKLTNDKNAMLPSVHQFFSLKIA